MNDHQDAKELEVLPGFNTFKDFLQETDAFMPTSHGLTHNRQATASLGAINQRMEQEDVVRVCSGVLFSPREEQNSVLREWNELEDCYIN